MRTPREVPRRGGTVSLAVPNADQVCAELAEREIIVDYRPEVGLRLGPHFYNTEAEVESTLDAIEEIVGV